MGVPRHSNDWTARTIARDDKGRLPGRGQSDNGRGVLLERGIDGCDGDCLDGLSGRGRETTKLSKDDAVKHGRLGFETDTAHDGDSFGWVLACGGEKLLIM